MGGFAKLGGQNWVVEENLNVFKNEDECTESTSTFNINCKSAFSTMLLLRHVIKTGSRKKEVT